MAVLSKPIPALYTVYILRSTVRHASLYIGSTPNPPRRLKQHNGQVRGGAARTARSSLRPWEMVALVSGFPSMVAALKFEWALDNAHLSLHIPSSSRLTVATQKKSNGHPRRPARSLVSTLSNIHLLLRVPSFARWPLRLHFFAPDVYKSWQNWCSTAAEPLPPDLPVLTDFGPAGPGTAIRGRKTSGKSATTQVETIDLDTDAAEGASRASNATTTNKPWGIHALPLTYEPLRAYIAKGDELFCFEREGPCVVCHEALHPGKALYALCPNDECDAVGHLTCWSAHLLGGQSQNGSAVSGGQDENSPILPVKGTCPKCGGDVQWGSMMKELTLRTRGPKEVEKMLQKKKRKRATEKTTVDSSQ